MCGCRLKQKITLLCVSEIVEHNQKSAILKLSEGRSTLFTVIPKVLRMLAFIYKPSGNIYMCTDKDNYNSNEEIRTEISV